MGHAGALVTACGQRAGPISSTRRRVQLGHQFPALTPTITTRSLQVCTTESWRNGVRPELGGQRPGPGTREGAAARVSVSTSERERRRTCRFELYSQRHAASGAAVRVSTCPPASRARQPLLEPRKPARGPGWVVRGAAVAASARLLQSQLQHPVNPAVAMRLAALLPHPLNHTALRLTHAAPPCCPTARARRRPDAARVVVIDVRDSDFAGGHIRGAVNIGAGRACGGWPPGAAPAVLPPAHPNPP